MARLKYFEYRYIYFYVLLSSVTGTLSWRPINRNVITPETQENINTENKAMNINDQITQRNVQKRNVVSPYIDLALCPLHTESWNCARQQSARLLDMWNNNLYIQWQKLKVEADRELNVTLAKRGYSGSETIRSNEKPSKILTKLEIGSNYVKDYLSKIMDGFLGNELELSAKNVDNDGVEEDKGEYDNDDTENNNKDAEKILPIIKESPEKKVIVNSKNELVSTGSNDKKFIEMLSNKKTISSAALKRLDGGTGKGQKNKRRKNKKKHGNTNVQPATVVLLQQPAAPIVHHSDDEYEHGGAGTEDVHVYHEQEDDGQSKPNNMKHRKQKRQKRRKNKRKDQHDYGLTDAHDGSLSSVLYGQHITGLGLGPLEDLISNDDWLVDGGKLKKTHATNYGRSIGVMRGKKKKKKKALMKLILLGSFLKAKIELLLKILGAHLQIKFFAIALIGLLINIARFWIDVKRGAAPQKVVYVEHAHHQHHYEDHGEEWSEPGGYWKRSLPGDSTTGENGVIDSYVPQDDAHYLAYRNQWTK